MDIGTLLAQQFMRAYNLSATMLAQALMLPLETIEALLNNTQPITVDIDLRLCRLFTVEEGHFLTVQNQLDAQKAKMAFPIDSITPLPPQPARPITVALICGGPSQERGISLNSARSVLDHLARKEITIIPIYVDVFKNFYLISKAQMYSNTPLDFDFKLQSTAEKMTSEEIVCLLKSVDLVFPAIHGEFGEDGTLQAFLEKHHIPFIGCSSEACKKMFDKHNAMSVLKRCQFPTIPSQVLTKGTPNIEHIITKFFQTHHLGRVVIKPVAGGSSIGVFSAYSPQEAFQKVQLLFQNTANKEALIESFCSGKEFTIIVLQDDSGLPVALIPTEIQVDYSNGGLFDYRRKYLPTSNTHWFCPPRFDDMTIEHIRKQAEELFLLFGMRDFARLDGWVLDDGSIIFSDFNPISGMEQNSFLFQQASRIGLCHADLLWHIVRKGALRAGLTLPKMQIQEEAPNQVYVIFGGNTAERQVSLMSGTNVWLKLRKSTLFTPTPFLLDHTGHLWKLPYTYTLNHTIEEIFEHCSTAAVSTRRIDDLLIDIQARLTIAPQLFQAKDHMPQRYSTQDFIELAQKNKAFIFLALHGGAGENGEWQEKLEQAHLSYNGSHPATSSLCMDKYLTGQAIQAMGDPKILSVPKRSISMAAYAAFPKHSLAEVWRQLQQELETSTCIIKPQRDGCSSGIVRLCSHQDLMTYISIVSQKIPSIPPNTFTHQTAPIEMPSHIEDDFLIEKFVETDRILIENNTLTYTKKSGWVELTVGVLENKGVFHSLNPSITIAEGCVLSVEEKFQGGTGVNITPPPDSIISEKDCTLIKRAIEKIAKALTIQNYARCDVFFNVDSKILYLIEVNTLPGLTPATVLYHQALAEPEAMYPTEFLEHIIKSAVSS